MFNQGSELICGQWQEWRGCLMSVCGWGMGENWQRINFWAVAGVERVFDQYLWLWHG